MLENPGVNDPANELQEHYVRAAYAFRQFVQAESKIVSIEWNQNPKLKAKFEAKQKEFASKRRPTDTMLIWHGTGSQNIESICESGFMIPGKHRIGVAHGTALGYGVYTATGPDTSMGYCHG
jgi:hypothetical protein